MISTLLATLFLSLDRVFIAKHLGYTALGIYSAYYMSSFMLFAQLGQLFTNVFLPASAKSENKGFVKKIDSLFKIGFIPLVAFSCLVLVVMLSFFGKAYTLRLDYVILFSVLSIIYFFQSLYNTIIIDLPINKYKIYIIVSNIMNLVVMFLFFFMVYNNSLTIQYILFALITDIIGIIAIQRFFINKYLIFIKAPHFV
jgi:O-antigen/teichoic acid export membrane protein